MTDNRTLARAVLLSSGPPISLKVLYCLHRLGIETDVIDLRKTSIARFSRYRRKYCRFPQEETARFGEWLADYIARNHVDAVIGGDILSTGLLHEVKDRIAGTIIYPSSSASTLEMLDDKWRFHEFMREHAIPCPSACLIREVRELDSLEHSGLVFPVMVKPLHGESSHGIVRAQSPDDIRRYLGSPSKYARLPLMLQEFAQGYDADLSILAREGEVICHVLQSRRRECSLEFIGNAAVLDIGKRVAAACGFTGVANIDVRIDESTGRVLVLECNPRFWYTLQASLWRGLNFVEAGLALARGESAERESPVGGVYHLHGCLLKRLLWNPRKWSTIGRYNLQGLWQAVSDPLPFVYGRWGR